MKEGLLILSVLLAAASVAVCALIYFEQASSTRSAKRRQGQLNILEHRLQELHEVQVAIQRRIDQLSTDVLQREIYQSANDRHQQAIKDAKAGRSLDELMLRHGLSSDEAALTVALHTKEKTTIDDKKLKVDKGLSLSTDLS